jgi:protein-tyrosine phosphatase
MNASEPTALPGGSPAAPAGGLPHEIALERGSNLRDLGGYPARAGRRVRFGRLYRSAALPDLSPADWQRVAALGLRTVGDFRGAQERMRAPMPIAGAETVSLAVEPTVGAGLRDILATRDATGEDLMTLLRRAYEDYALGCTAQFTRLFALILEPDGLPLLYHCSAGKDRTGFASALILSAVGVSWDVVVQDYLATNRLWRRDTVPSKDLSPALAEILLGAHVELLEAAFEAIRRTDGSIDAYLERALGIDAAGRQRLDALLTEPA